MKTIRHIVTLLIPVLLFAVACNKELSPQTVTLEPLLRSVQVQST